jgi:hypothetical protein
VFSFVASFLLAAGAVAVLRGSSGGGPAKSTTPVVVTTSKPLPSTGAWRITVAVVMGGRRSPVKVLHSPTRPKELPRVDTVSPPRDDGAAARTLQDVLRSAATDKAKRAAIAAFLGAAGIVGAGGAAAPTDDTGTAVASVALLGAALGECLPGIPSTIIAKRMKAVEPVGLGMDRPHVTFSKSVGAETVVAQVAIKGRGPRRVAVAIIARGPSGPPAAAPSAVAGGKAALTTVGGWLEDNLHAPKPFKPAC